MSNIWPCGNCPRTLISEQSDGRVAPLPDYYPGHLNLLLLLLSPLGHSPGRASRLASGALPSAFPAIEIEGEHYWDGGLVSNTPLQWVVVAQPRRDTLAFQVDLWSASGEFPSNMLEVITREKEIRYSSRTRAATDQFKYIQRLRGAAAGLLDKLPDDLENSPEAQLLRPAVNRKSFI